MVFSVAHQYVAVGHNSDAFEPFELAVTGSPAAECPQERRVRVEYLDTVITGVRDQYVTLVINSNAPENQYESFR